MKMVEIESYSFGRVVIDGEVYTDDVLVFPDRVKDGWWREEGHSVCMEDIQEVLEHDPDTFIVGTGSSGRVSVPEDFRKELESRGIEVRKMKTAKAKDVFNRLVDEGKDIVAGLHLTC